MRAVFAVVCVVAMGCSDAPNGGGEQPEGVSGDAGLDDDILGTWCGAALGTGPDCSGCLRIDADGTYLTSGSCYRAGTAWRAAGAWHTAGDRLVLSDADGCEPAWYAGEDEAPADVPGRVLTYEAVSADVISLDGAWWDRAPNDLEPCE
jgi:hypothetical protein